jgi:hypothetical protein
MKFINTTGIIHNTVHANDIHFYDEIHAVIDQEPTSAFSPEVLDTQVPCTYTRLSEKQGLIPNCSAYPQLVW